MDDGAGRVADRAAVRSAMAFHDRRHFLRRRDRWRAGEDRPLPIGHGQTNSQPATVEDMLAALGVAPGHRILDVGAGSGWTTALLAHLVGPHGSVIGIERVERLTRRARANLSARPGLTWARIDQATPGVLGAPADAPFDRILVSAAATAAVPAMLIEQLAQPGVMVIPVDQRLLRIRRTVGGDVETTELGAYRFVPLIADR
ncbi:MAG: protein-L-isoaspartate O-methyltransferase family protein [Desertimonas sp.]